MSRNEYDGGHDTGVHATEIVLFVVCRRSCGEVSSAQGEEITVLPELHRHFPW
jgi:hypothetical protein